MRANNNKEFVNYYKVLDVNLHDSNKVIKQQYHKLILKFHPDHNKSPGANETFRTIDEAYKVLSDKEKRAKYDVLYQKYVGFKQANITSDTDSYDYIHKPTVGFFVHPVRDFFHTDDYEVMAQWVNGIRKK